MKYLLALALTFALTHTALADPAADAASCQKSAGSYLAGKVVKAPTFAHGHPQKGVELSHTHITLQGDDGKRYDVAMDNVFANGYRKNVSAVPDPLNTIKLGDRLELCGQKYTDGTSGIHWVHTNCGAKPTAQKPDGWVRKVAADGTAGPNMTANQSFCSLWPN